jgi:hypothetical protein
MPDVLPTWSIEVTSGGLVHLKFALPQTQNEFKILTVQVLTKGICVPKKCSNGACPAFRNNEKAGTLYGTCKKGKCKYEPIIVA